MTCGVVTAVDAPGVSAGGGQGPGGTMEVPTLTIFRREGRPPADDIFVYSGCPQPVSPCPGPGPAEEARPPHALAGLLAVGIAAEGLDGEAVHLLRKAPCSRPVVHDAATGLDTEDKAVLLKSGSALGTAWP